jgi:SAM-dependent methyltransferase
MRLVKRVGKYGGLGGIHGSAVGDAGVRERLKLLGEVAPLTGESLVDIGCGDGAYTRRLASGFATVLAIDVEEDRVEYFRQSGHAEHVRVVCGDASALDVAPDTVDLVTAIEVVEHLGAGFGDVVSEVCRVLRPGGYFAITTPNRGWPLEQHGWVLRGFRFHGVLFPGLTWIRPLHRRLSDADVFGRRELDARVERFGLTCVGHRYMWPPMDSHKRLRRFVKPLFRLTERLGLAWLAQTHVVAYRKDVMSA